MSSIAHRDAMVDQVIGQCIIESRLGEGGMGMVYLGRHTVLNKPVALKLLRQNLPTDHNGVERFVREARAAASLDHPAIVNVYDAGRENGQYYIVMQYVEGESLSARLEREHRIPIDEALAIFEAAAEGVEHAHSKGIIHRDLKPDNILLGVDGSVKIVDFGLARVLEYDANISQTGTVVGSPTFMSPEQALGKKTDARADIYSLGATLYQMVTGEPPFRARGFMEAIWKIVKESPLAAHQVAPDVPLELSRYIHSLMRKDPRNRPQSIEEALDNLGALVQAGGLQQRRGGSRWLLRCAVALTVVAALALGAWYLVPWTELVAWAEERVEASPGTTTAPPRTSPPVSTPSAGSPPPAVDKGPPADPARGGRGQAAPADPARGRGQEAPAERSGEPDEAQLPDARPPAADGHRVEVWPVAGGSDEAVDAAIEAMSESFDPPSRVRPAGGGGFASPGAERPEGALDGAGSLAPES